MALFTRPRPDGPLSIASSERRSNTATWKGGWEGGRGAGWFICARVLVRYVAQHQRLEQVGTLSSSSWVWSVAVASAANCCRPHLATDVQQGAGGGEASNAPADNDHSLAQGRALGAQPEAGARLAVQGGGCSAMVLLVKAAFSSPQR